MERRVRDGFGAMRPCVLVLLALGCLVVVVLAGCEGGIAIAIPSSGAVAGGGSASGGEVEAGTTASPAPGLNIVIPLPTTPSPPTHSPGDAAAPATPLGATVAPQATTVPGPPDAIGRLSIPALGIEAPIVSVGWTLGTVAGESVALWSVSDVAVGHHRGTALPGQIGNCVLSGHSRGPAQTSLAALASAEVGQRVHVSVSSRQGTYEIVEVIRVQEVGAPLEERLAHGGHMDPSNDTRLTLVTCWPDWAYTHRVLVVAKGL